MRMRTNSVYRIACLGTHKLITLVNLFFTTELTTKQNGIMKFTLMIPFPFIKHTGQQQIFQLLFQKLLRYFLAAFAIICNEIIAVRKVVDSNFGLGCIELRLSYLNQFSII